MKASFKLALAVFVFHAVHSAQANTIMCGPVFQIESRHDQKAFENIAKSEGSFTRHRGINSYEHALGESLMVAINKGLNGGKEFHWLDAGGGEGNAIAQVLGANPQRHFTTTLLAYETPAVAADRMAVLKGRFIENIPTKELPKSDLITDVFGPMAYSSRPDMVLSKYLESLKPGGKIILSLGAGYGVFGNHNKVSLSDGRLATFTEWIRGLEGLNTDFRMIKRPTEFNEGEIQSIEITLKDGKVPEIPQLELLHIKDGMPPEMIFKQVQKVTKDHLDEQTQLSHTLHDKYVKTSANQFFDAFRANVWFGSWTHPVLGSIKKLNTSDSWILMTPNAANIKAEILSEGFSLKDSKYQGWGQSYHMWRARNAFKPLTGVIQVGQIQSLPRQGKTQLITDYAGPIQSSTRPDLVLKSYLESLSDKGELYLFLGDGRAGYGESTFVLNKSDKKIYFLSWLSKIPGLKMETHRDPYDTGGLSSVKIRISDREKVQIPELEFLGLGELNADGIPTPLFSETGAVIKLRHQ